MRSRCSISTVELPSAAATWAARAMASASSKSTKSNGPSPPRAKGPHEHEAQPPFTPLQGVRRTSNEEPKVLGGQLGCVLVNYGSATVAGCEHVQAHAREAHRLHVQASVLRVVGSFHARCRIARIMSCGRRTRLSLASALAGPRRFMAPSTYSVERRRVCHGCERALREPQRDVGELYANEQHRET